MRPSLKLDFLDKEKHTMPPRDIPSGLREIRTRTPPAFPPGPVTAIAGKVAYLEGYAQPGFVGCYAGIISRSEPDVWTSVFTSEQRLQSLLETAFASGHEAYCQGQKDSGADFYNLVSVLVPGELT